MFHVTESNVPSAFLPLSLLCHIYALEWNEPLWPKVPIWEETDVKYLSQLFSLTHIRHRRLSWRIQQKLKTDRN